METISNFEDIKLKQKGYFPYYLKIVMCGLIIAGIFIGLLVGLFSFGGLLIELFIKYWMYFTGTILILIFIFLRFRKKKGEKNGHPTR